MKLTSSEAPNGSITGILRSVQRKGVRFWSKNGQLHYKSPKGALTPEEIEKLRVFKGEIASLLQYDLREESDEPRLEACPRPYNVPLTFAQLAHWHLYKLDERPAIRQIAAAIRLRGYLNVDALRRSVAENVRRHDALRTCIVVVDGVPVQRIHESQDDDDLKVDDLTALPDGRREAEVKRLIEDDILRPIDIAVGPLFGMRLVKLLDDEHVLIVVMEHIVSDGFSRSILLRDIFAAYTQALQRCSISLPKIPIQFADYAIWQQRAHTSWTRNHGAYWDERVARWGRLKFPFDGSVEVAGNSGWGVVTVKLCADMKRALGEWARSRRTTLVMSVFTAYVGLVLRWCNAVEAVFQYQSEGRVDARLQNTIGFFATMLYLQVQLLEDDSFIDLGSRITKEYCNAYEHTDFSYIASQDSPPEFTRNSIFNWIPQELPVDLHNCQAGASSIACSPIDFEHPIRKIFDMDGEPSIGLVDTDDGITGYVAFPRSRFSTHTMERFARNFVVFVEALLRNPEERVKDIVLA